MNTIEKIRQEEREKILKKLEDEYACTFGKQNGDRIHCSCLSACIHELRGEYGMGVRKCCQAEYKTNDGETDSYICKECDKACDLISK